MLSLMLLTNVATGLHELACIGLGSPLYKSTGNKLQLSDLWPLNTQNLIFAVL
jgi:hypothetical protein